MEIFYGKKIFRTNTFKIELNTFQKLLNTFKLTLKKLNGILFDLFVDLCMLVKDDPKFPKERDQKEA